MLELMPSMYKALVSIFSVYGEHLFPYIPFLQGKTEQPGAKRPGADNGSRVGHRLPLPSKDSLGRQENSEAKGHFF